MTTALLPRLPREFTAALTKLHRGTLADMDDVERRAALSGMGWLVIDYANQLLNHPRGMEALEWARRLPEDERDHHARAALAGATAQLGEFACLFVNNVAVGALTLEIWADKVQPPPKGHKPQDKRNPAFLDAVLRYQNEGAISDADIQAAANDAFGDDPSIDRKPKNLRKRYAAAREAYEERVVVDPMRRFADEDAALAPLREERARLESEIADATDRLAKLNAEIIPARDTRNMIAVNHELAKMVIGEKPPNKDLAARVLKSNT